MLSWIFKKRETSAAARPDAIAARAAEAAAATEQAAQAKSQARADAAAGWASRLEQARGDDAALLAVALEAPGAEIKRHAVAGITGEETLKRAEREFRTHDRRVHREAKQRLDAAVAQREARERAGALISTARALALEETIPLNRLVEIDRGWKALDSRLLDDSQKAEFAALSLQLTTVTHARGEQQQRLARWIADSGQALTQARLVCVEVVADALERVELSDSAARLKGLIDGAPADPSVTAPVNALKLALETTGQVEAQLMMLEEFAQPRAAVAQAEPVGSVDEAALLATPDMSAGLLSAAPAGPTSAEAPVPVELPASPTPAESHAPVETPASRWRSRSPITDLQLAAALDNRYDAWQRANAPARSSRPVVDPRRAAIVEQREAARQQRHQERGTAVAGLVLQAEEALAAGHLAQAHEHLVAIDTALERGTAAEALRERIGVLHGEVARLKGWQHWSGGRARDELVVEAETLAELIGGPRQRAVADQPPPDAAKVMETGEGGASVGAGAPDASIATPRTEPNPADASIATSPTSTPMAHEPMTREPMAATPAPSLSPVRAAKPPRPDKPLKVPVKELTVLIDDLRKRWRELDRLGGATSQTLWQRFDSALKVAYVPVAEQLDKLKAMRQENLEARMRLLEALDALPLVQPALEPGAEAGTELAENGSATSLTTWKDQARALESFQAEWRKLGPVEHTVPHKARDRLLARLQASVARVEAPLQQARRTAQAEREHLVARARALADEMAANPQNREAIPRVRELQAEWQQHAKSLPLARHAEGQLWADFKAATDAVFEQRDAAIDARDAQFAANLATREALIARLEALQPDSPAAEIVRALADADGQWRNMGEAPRREAASVEARFRAARETAQHHLANRAQRAWNATCDALLEKIATCESLEDSGGTVPASMRPSEAASEEAPGGGVELQDAVPTLRWADAPALPASWESALARRRDRAGSASPVSADAASGAAIDTLLLQLESGLDTASPPAFQSARRDMKLRALKAALEGRQSPSAAGEGVQPGMAALLGHAGMTAEQRERLRHIVAALRLHGLPGPARP
ncbi:hypothetical protein BH11PSE8_BH11PSE8_07350 [soil metagenome]